MGNYEVSTFNYIKTIFHSVGDIKGFTTLAILHDLYHKSKSNNNNNNNTFFSSNVCSVMGRLKINLTEEGYNYYNFLAKKAGSPFKLSLMNQPELNDYNNYLKFLYQANEFDDLGISPNITNNQIKELTYKLESLFKGYINFQFKDYYDLKENVN